MSVLDVVLLIVLVGVFFSGFWKGAIRIVFSIGGFAGGLVLAVAAGPALEVQLRPLTGPVWVAVALSRILPVLVCLVLGFVAGWGLERTLRALHLNWINRLAGAVVAGMLGALVLGIILQAGAQLSQPWARVCRHSRLAPVLMRVPALVLPRGPHTATDVRVSGRSSRL